MVVQGEVLYALLGYTGKVVVDRDGAFQLASGLPLLDASERVLLQKLLHLGECYSRLERFCTAELLDANGADHDQQPPPGSFRTAFALGLEECLQPYRSRVLALEQRLIRTPRPLAAGAAAGLRRP